MLDRIVLAFRRAAIAASRHYHFVSSSTTSTSALGLFLCLRASFFSDVSASHLLTFDVINGRLAGAECIRFVGSRERPTGRDEQAERHDPLLIWWWGGWWLLVCHVMALFDFCPCAGLAFVELSSGIVALHFAIYQREYSAEYRRKERACYDIA